MDSLVSITLYRSPFSLLNVILQYFAPDGASGFTGCVVAINMSSLTGRCFPVYLIGANLSFQRSGVVGRFGVKLANRSYSIAGKPYYIASAWGKKVQPLMKTLYSQRPATSQLALSVGTTQRRRIPLPSRVYGPETWVTGVRRHR
jgi:hypothetical protein